MLRIIFDGKVREIKILVCVSTKQFMLNLWITLLSVYFCHAGKNGGLGCLPTIGFEPMTLAV